MIKEPRIEKFIDDEEKSLFKAIELDSYEQGVSTLSESRRKELKQIAQSTMNEERTRISLRIPSSDLSRIKARALREGMPYQTLINAILHKEAIK